MSGRRGVVLAVLWTAVTTLVLPARPVIGQTFSSGSTGADGPFNPSCASTPCTVTVALPADGVFNFTTINVPADVTVVFTRNAANTPVTMLASGDVTIGGTIDVSGRAGGPFGAAGLGGNGGFDGGMGGLPTEPIFGTPGSGPGGGAGGTSTVGNSANGSGGGYGGPGVGLLTGGAGGGQTYGLRTLLPLIGGSGGGGGSTVQGRPGGGGGGGGGAILVASSGTLTVNGMIKADGGNAQRAEVGGAFPASFSGGGGSGGGIRLVANRLTGNAAITAIGGPLVGISNSGGVGRIRLEAFEMTLGGSVTPPPSSAQPSSITPPPGFPTVKIARVAGVAAPVNPQGSFVTEPDIVLSPTVTSPVTVDLEASNVPVGTIIIVAVTPEGAAKITFNSTPLAGTLAASTATASVTLPNGVSVISATATFATSVAGLPAPLLIGGQEVKWIRVGASYGGRSSTEYITASGRTIAVR